jgi:hypothetical protein
MWDETISGVIFVITVAAYVWLISAVDLLLN